MRAPLCQQRICGLASMLEGEHAYASRVWACLHIPGPNPLYSTRLQWHSANPPPCFSTLPAAQCTPPVLQHHTLPAAQCTHPRAPPGSSGTVQSPPCSSITRSQLHSLVPGKPRTALTGPTHRKKLRARRFSNRPIRGDFRASMSEAGT